MRENSSAQMLFSLEQRSQHSVDVSAPVELTRQRRWVANEAGLATEVGFVFFRVAFLCEL